MQINGLNVLITGGGSGLGAATARNLTELGARVAILDLPSSKGQDVANSLEGGLFVDGWARRRARGRSRGPFREAWWPGIQ